MTDKNAEFKDNVKLSWFIVQNYIWSSREQFLVRVIINYSS